MSDELTVVRISELDELERECERLRAENQRLRQAATPFVEWSKGARRDRAGASDWVGQKLLKWCDDIRAAMNEGSDK